MLKRSKEKIASPEGNSKVPVLQRELEVRSHKVKANRKCQLTSLATQFARIETDLHD